MRSPDPVPDPDREVVTDPARVAVELPDHARRIQELLRTHWERNRRSCPPDTPSQRG